MTRHAHVDANEVMPRLWVGSAPDPEDRPRMRDHGFTHVVLCAADHQHPASAFPDVVVVHCPFEDDDSIMSGATMALVFATARAVAEAHGAGGTILVTCQAGINRSALVAALAMRMLGVAPWVAVERIRAGRYSNCLCNAGFRRIALGENRAASYYTGEPIDEEARAPADDPSFVNVLAGVPDYVALEWAHSRYERPEDEKDPDKIPERVSVGIAFGESGFGFGSIGILQTKRGLFLDTECMGLDRAKGYVGRLLDLAITDTDQDPVRHKLFNEESGRSCNDRCEACAAARKS